MSKNLRSRDKTVLNLLYIGAANSARGNANQHFAFGDPRHGNVFDNNAALATVNSRAHCGGKRLLRRLGSFENCPGTAHCAATSPGSTGINRSPRVPV